MDTIAELSGLPTEYVNSRMVYGENEVPGYINFLKKFELLNSIEWNRDAIDMTIEDVVRGVASEGIDYTEIKFSVGKYLRYLDEPIKDIIIWVSRVFARYAAQYGIEVDLTLSLQYESDRQFQEAVANTIKDDTVSSYIAGIDLVGNENYFDVDFYKPIYNLWKDAGKVCIAHVGELPDKIDHVRKAIDILGIHRVCHGIAAAHDLEIAKISRDRNVAFDIGITSNLRTGVATIDHPVKYMIDNGFIINIGTDDPTIVDTTLKREYDLLRTITGCSEDEIDDIRENSCRYSSKSLISCL